MLISVLTNDLRLVQANVWRKKKKKKHLKSNDALYDDAF